MHWPVWTLAALLTGYAIVTRAGIIVWAAAILLGLWGYRLSLRKPPAA